MAADNAPFRHFPKQRESISPQLRELHGVSDRIAIPQPESGSCLSAKRRNIPSRLSAFSRSPP